MIRVDGNAYAWMGAPISTNVNQTAFEYTSTKSIFTMDIDGAIQLNLTFLSPITPNDLKRQSLVFSYLNVDVASIDGKSHDVQVYSDISAGEFSTSFERVSSDQFRMGVGKPQSTRGVGLRCDG